MLDIDGEAPELRALASHYSGKGGALWVAGAAEGMVAAAPLGGGDWEIGRVYVHPRLHGTGLGHRLAEVAEGHAIAAGAGRLLLWTDTRFRRAHRFYENRGWVRAGPVRALGDLSHTLEFEYAKPVHGVRRLDAAAAQSAERALAGVLEACMDAGASVSFLPPLARDRARAFWQGVTRQVGQGQTLLFAAWSGGRLAGTVQLGLDMPENGRHRAEVSQLLVHPAHRRRGLASTLMQAAEAAARLAGRDLLMLDTRAGDPAEQLYRRLGWAEAGRIEDYTREADGQPHATVLFTKRIGVPISVPVSVPVSVPGAGSTS